ncbi:Uncharacterized protein BP5553_00248 [Venustampulla echinocandica]|uniref:EKC/KEOPS complex subunit GON7 n=1 Tax=Venustampulla echinocandica TaxID=2656787 RepID=A0A370TXN1_9HELO|nr:Uncharacterized protein BP5553_00248 [Venustampulla echinocandica]RDL40269.1 Uncharacterized protein BP5553_00248 [Venustampulla echinocandica]
MAAPESLSSTSNGSAQVVALTATYKSPTNEAFTLAHEVPALASDKVSEKTAYLSALRKATAVLQEQVNKELTARMEEDKARVGGPTNGVSNTVLNIDEAEEEDNYGEEVAEEEG